MRILVVKGRQRMWVSNPEKIKFWEARAADCAFRNKLSDIKPEVRILKRLNDG